MAGNVWEWTRSRWGKDGGTPDFKYPYDGSDGRESLDALPVLLRVLRGGSFFFDSTIARCAIRSRAGPEYRDVNVGFRVVLSPTSEF
jgi:formylglycine-generating enzyme required for sulfatase activity